MSEENVEIVRNGFDAFNAFMRGEGAEKALAALADPEFEYDWPAERDLPEPDHHGVSRRSSRSSSGFKANGSTSSGSRLSSLRHRAIASSPQSVKRARPRERPASRIRVLSGLHDPRWTSAQTGVLPPSRRGPRSRRAAGVGDVGGERRGRSGVRESNAVSVGCHAIDQMEPPSRPIRDPARGVGGAGVRRGRRRGGDRKRHDRRLLAGSLVGAVS